MPAAAVATAADYAAGAGRRSAAEQRPPRQRPDGGESAGSAGPSTACDYRSSPDAGRHEAFVRDAVRLMLEQAVFRGTDRRRPVLNWKGPEQLRAAFDFRLDRSATTHGHLLRLIEDTIEHSVKTGHPYFVNQLFSRYDVGTEKVSVGDNLFQSVKT